MAETISRAELRKLAAQSLSLYAEVTCGLATSPPHASIQVPKLKDLAVDDEKFKWAFLRIDGNDTEWRLVSNIDMASSVATITVQRGFTSQIALNAVLGLFGLLSIDEWNQAIDEAIRDRFYDDRITIPLVAGQNDYAANTSWLQSKGQLKRMRYRNTAQASAPVEDEVPVVYTREEANALTFHLPALPPVSDTSLIIEARHYYGSLTLDTQTVTIPWKLAVASVKWQALQKIFQKLGPAAKRTYSQQMFLTEKALGEAESKFLSPDPYRDWNDESIPISGNPESRVAWTW